MKFSFHPGTEAELNEAVDYYEEIATDLGFDFAVDVYVAIRRAVLHLEAYRSTILTAQLRPMPCP